jgi:hypothetical protein
MREIYIEKEREEKGVYRNYKWEMGNSTHHDSIFY